MGYRRLGLALLECRRESVGQPANEKAEQKCAEQCETYSAANGSGELSESRCQTHLLFGCRVLNQHLISGAQHPESEPANDRIAKECKLGRASVHSRHQE